MAITSSSIPGVSASTLNVLAILLSGLDGSPLGLRGQIENLLTEISGIFEKGGIPVRFQNATGGALAKGDLVYVSAYSSTTGYPEVALADSDAVGKPAMYVLLEAIANGASGEGAQVATISGLNTSAFLEDDLLYLSNTGTTGNTVTKTPTSAAGAQRPLVGMCEIVHATTGRVRFDLAASAIVQQYASRILLADAGSAITAVEVEAALQEIFLLARGNVYYGDAAGKLARADIKALGAILAGDGADAVVVNLLTAALGGTSFTARSYAGGTLQEPAEDATLMAAIGSLMLLRRDAAARLLLDDATPSATAGRGLVVSGSGVTPQAVPDASVIVAAGVAYNQQGRRVLCTVTPVLAVTDPNPLGGVRNDIVVIPAAGGAPVVREGAVIATDPALTAGDVPLARLRCPNGAVTITVAEIDDLRQTARTVPADKLLPAATADLLVLLATDQVTNAVLLQAIANGAFVADDATRALFGAGFLGATAIGRALIATGFFDATKALDAFAADSFANAFLLQAVADGAFVADDTTRLLFADDFVSERLLSATIQGVRAHLVMDETTPPTAAAGQGMVPGVGNELLVEAQAVPDLTVRVQLGGEAISHHGVSNVSAAVASLAGFTIPAGAGEQRCDIVVMDNTGAVVRRVGVEGAPPAADAVLTDGDTPIARVTLTQGADVSILAGNLTDLRNRTAINPLKIPRGLTWNKLAGSAAVANVPAAGVATLNHMGIFAMAPAGAGAWNLDSFAGLDDGEWAWLTISDAAKPCTIRDNAVGAGNIWTQRAASIVLASLADLALVVRDGARYKVVWAVLQAGQPSATSGTQAVTGSSASTSLAELLPMPVLGAWAVDGDIRGGGMVGQSPVAPAVPQAAAYAVVYDHGTTTYALLSASAGMGGGGIYTANFQAYPDVETIDDAVYFGADVPFAEIRFDLTATVGVYANDSVVWEYWTGAAWVAIAAPLYDNTEPAVHTGVRPFQASGALMLVPPADWATTTINGQLAYWIRSRVTAAQITTAAVLADEHTIVIGEDPWAPPYDGALTAIRVVDNAAVLHTTADVIFVLWDSATGASRTFTWAQDRRRQRLTCTSWSLTTASRLQAIVVQEDGAAEPTGVMIELEYAATHLHAAGTLAGPSHAHLV